MLVLSRQRDESIIIGDNIVVTIVDIRGDKVRLGINAPTEIPVHRQEVYEAIQRENLRASRLEPKDTREVGKIARGPNRPNAAASADPARSADAEGLRRIQEDVAGQAAGRGLERDVVRDRFVGLREGADADVAETGITLGESDRGKRRAGVGHQAHVRVDLDSPGLQRPKQLGLPRLGIETRI